MDTIRKWLPEHNTRREVERAKAEAIIQAYNGCLTMRETKYYHQISAKNSTPRPTGCC